MVCQPDRGTDGSIGSRINLKTIFRRAYKIGVVAAVLAMVVAVPAYATHWDVYPYDGLDSHGEPVHYVDAERDSDGASGRAVFESYGEHLIVSNDTIWYSPTNTMKYHLYVDGYPDESGYVYPGDYVHLNLDYDENKFIRLEFCVLTSHGWECDENRGET